MKRYFKYLKEDKLILRLYILTSALIVVTMTYIFINYNKLPPLLPIFNQLPWGERRLSATPGIFVPSVIVSAIFVFNTFVSALIYSNSPLISRMLAITSFLTTLLALLFTLRTIVLII
ncbi:MAG: hypothetical protein HY426_03755 [Candidatus Levybacteria bacterium]|nr:hypothetical protein [Candidatus Levybacteria bacterium]